MSDRISVGGDHLEKVYDSFFRGPDLVHQRRSYCYKCVKGRFEMPIYRVLGRSYLVLQTKYSVLESGVCPKSGLHFTTRTKHNINTDQYCNILICNYIILYTAYKRIKEKQNSPNDRNCILSFSNAFTSFFSGFTVHLAPPHSRARRSDCRCS